MMGRTARVTVSDGRVVEGQLYCIDKQRNIVIKGAQMVRKSTGETRPARGLGGMAAAAACSAVLARCSAAAEGTETAADRARRWLGIIMVPGAHATKIEIAEDA